MVLTPEQQRRSRMRRMNLLMAYAALSAKSNEFPLSLFSGGEQGLLLDVSDLTTMFEDAAGTIPVTAAGQPVGRINDKSGRGNHATQSTAGSRPVYSIAPRTGVRNLVTFTEQFDNAVWIKVNVTVSQNAVTAPDGTLTADTFTYISGVAPIGCYQNSGNITLGTVQTWSVYVRNISGVPWIRMVGDVTGGNAWFDIQNGVLGTVNAGITASIQTVGDGWYRCSMTYAATANDPSNNTQVLGVSANGGMGYTLSGTGTYAIWGAQLEVGSTATAYQRVVTEREVTEAGVPSLGYLFFDGIDDSLSTGTINPGAVDKAQVFAGVRKLSDAARGIIAEFSDTIDANNGAFNLTAPNAASNTFAFESRGTTLTDAVGSGFTAPLTGVLTGLGDIAGDRTTLRVNGSQADQDTGDQGTGNYGSYELRIGSRGGSSLRFNGWLYGLIVRFSSANLNDATIAQAEAWMNGKTGAY